MVSLLNAAAVEEDVYSMAVFEDGGDEARYRGLGREVGGVDCCFVT